MKKAAILIIILTQGISCMRESPPRVIIQTEQGNIIAELYTEKAPVTAAHFMDLCRMGAFTNASFYRVVRMNNQPGDRIKIEVIQGGLRDDDLLNIYPAIPHETTDDTGILHKDGTVSMARNEPGSATTEFFICIGDQPELDYGGKRNPDGQGFAAFGKVIRGMDLVRSIQQGRDSAQFLIHPVVIKNIVLEIQ